MDIKLSLSLSNCLHNRVVLRKRNVLGLSKGYATGERN